jgi:hypothetical protein
LNVGVDYDKIEYLLKKNRDDTAHSSSTSKQLQEAKSTIKELQQRNQGIEMQLTSLGEKNTLLLEEKHEAETQYLLASKELSVRDSERERQDLIDREREKVQLKRDKYMFKAFATHK